MPVYEIHHAELIDYSERQKRGEILILAMTVTPTGYKLDIKETPHFASSLVSADKAPKAKVEPLKTPVMAPQAQEQPVKEALLCPHCTNPLSEDGTCNICQRFWKIREFAAARRRAWYLFKKGEGPRPL